MSKDPAFLFYTADFIMGTISMTDEEVGKYVRLLCIQHQHGGLIDKITFDNIANNSTNIKSKFIETEDGYYNKRLLDEMIKRQKKSNNLSINAMKRWDAEKQKKCKCNANAMLSVNENINKDKDINKAIDIPFSEIVELYHSILPNLPKISKITDQRKSAIGQRWKEYPDIEIFRKVFEITSKSEFLMGTNKSGWKADFDFIMTKSKFVKILEGSYNNNETIKKFTEAEINNFITAKFLGKEDCSYDELTKMYAIINPQKYAALKERNFRV